MPKYVRRKEEKEEAKSKDRPRRRAKIPVEKAPAFFEWPTYTCADNSSAGGKYSRAVLGPNGIVAIGNKADPNLPLGIRAAGRAYEREHFVAGHLLNGEFGGSGKDSDNLTILSSSGNGNHKKFDNNIKLAIQMLKKIYEVLSANHVDIGKVTYGVEVSVRVSDGKWDTTGYGALICKELICGYKIYGDLKPYEASEFWDDVDKYNKKMEAFLKKSVRERIFNLTVEEQEELKGLKEQRPKTTSRPKRGKTK